MLVRWFAGAAEAAGTTEEVVTDLGPSGVGEALATLHPDAASVLARCSFLADGRRVAADQVIDPGVQTLDVLPPFAGG